MDWIKINRPIVISYAFILIVIIWVSANLNWGDGRWNNIVKHDGNGYYAYLPAIFIYQDLTFTFINDIKDEGLKSNIKRDFVTKKDGLVFNKYYMGTSVVLIPFFFLGHAANWLFGLPLDGYATFYRIFVQIGNIFYLLAGLILMVKILKLYDTSPKIIALSLIALVLGTNVFYYVVSEPSMSHIYSFAFVNLFVYCALQYFKSFKFKFYFIGIVSLALITLIRPVNVLVIFSIPFLAGGLKNLILGFKLLFKNWKILTAGVLVFIIIVSLQLMIYKVQTGYFFIYSYTDERFNFLEPNMLKFMFSYRKGFLLYTPILLLSLFGMLYFNNLRYKAITLALFLLLIVYIFSSWWMWYYGGSFSQRVMIEYYIYFFIPFTLLLQETRFPKTIKVITVLLILICQIQTYQYQRGYIHWSEMNKERYWDSFLRIDKVIKGAEKDWE